MLARILEHRREVAAFVGPLVADPYLFSHAADSSTPMDPDFLTKRVAVLERVAVLKGHLGIENKQPATIAAEHAGLRLYRAGRSRGRRARPARSPRAA